jgi:hypothetical protein
LIEDSSKKAEAAIRGYKNFLKLTKPQFVEQIAHARQRLQALGSPKDGH